MASGLAMLALVIALAPFIGHASDQSIPGTAKFSVDIRGKSGQIVHLRAVGVPTGYIASFCTDRVCAPFAVGFSLPRSGVASIELQLIENAAGAHKPRVVTVAADGAHAASILFSRATR